MTKKPNIVVMISDQQRIDTLGFRGLSSCKTPHIDRIASEGVSFDRTICTSPLCAPSRASLFTGKYPHQLDFLSNNATLLEKPVLTDRLRASGYHTAYAGKWHLEPEKQPLAFQGREEELGLSEVHGGVILPTGRKVIDRWFEFARGQGSSEYSQWCIDNGLPDGWPVSDPDVRTHRVPSMTIPKTKRQDLDFRFTYDSWVTDFAIQYLKERSRQQPFFLAVSWFGPHPPFLIPEPYYNMYDPETIPEPPNFGLQEGHPEAVATSYYHQLYLDHGDDWDQWKKTMAVYWGYCSMIDAQVGRVLAELEEQQIQDETLIVFLSDHGEQLGSHGLWQKFVPYEESIRVPFIWRPPQSKKAGMRSDAPASLIDLVPTLLSYIGEEAPSDMMGRSLLPYFDSKEPDDESEIRYQFSEHKPLGPWHNAVEWRLVTDNRRKYVWNCDDLDELYDLESDPYERKNLINDPDYQEPVAVLRSQLADWMDKTNDPLRTRFCEAMEGLSAVVT